MELSVEKLILEQEPVDALRALCDNEDLHAAASKQDSKPFCAGELSAL